MMYLLYFISLLPIYKGRNMFILNLGIVIFLTINILVKY